MIVLKVKVAKNIKDKLVGLIGKEKPENLLIKTRFGIHTFFMKFPIDVLVLDRNNKIVNLKENLKPNRFFFWNPKFDMVIELPAGTIKNLRIRIGEMLEPRT